MSDECAATEAQYWLERDGDVRGPYSFEILTMMWARKELRLIDRIRKDGTENWVEVALVMKSLDQAAHARSDGARTPQDWKSAITPKEILFCILMIIPAVLAGKIGGLTSFSFLRGFYESYTGSLTVSPLAQEVLQFISCGVAGFVFVWLGILTTPKIREISRWVFLGLAVIGAIALVSLNGLFGMVGQIVGAVFATYICYDD